MTNNTVVLNNDNVKTVETVLYAQLHLLLDSIENGEPVEPVAMKRVRSAIMALGSVQDNITLACSDDDLTVMVSAIDKHNSTNPPDFVLEARSKLVAALSKKEVASPAVA